MGGYTSPYGVFAEDDLPVIALESRKIPDPSERSLPNLFSSDCRKIGSRRHKRQDAASTFYTVSDLHLQTRGIVKKNIHSRTELDQSDALSAFYPIACFFREHNPTCQKPRDLLERYSLSCAFDFDNVLFIVFGGRQIHGVPELSRLIADFPDDPRGRRAIHVNIKNVKKNTDASLPDAIFRHRPDSRNFSIGRRYYGSGRVRNVPLRITEEPQKKSCKNQCGQRPECTHKPAQKRGSPHQGKRIIIAVRNHGEIREL